MSQYGYMRRRYTPSPGLEACRPTTGADAGARAGSGSLLLLPILGEAVESVPVFDDVPADG